MNLLLSAATGTEGRASAETTRRLHWFWGLPLGFAVGGLIWMAQYVIRNGHFPWPQ